MPAARTRVLICPQKSGQPCWIIDLPAWWQPVLRFEQYAGRRVGTGNPFYEESAFLLPAGEALALDQAGRERFAGDPRSREAYYEEALRRVKEMLASAAWVIVETYEWESGLE